LDFNRQHLQAELARMDLLLQRAVQRWQRAGQNFSDPFRGLTISPEQARAIAARPAGASWGDMVELEPEAEQAYRQSRLEAQRRIAAAVEAAQRAGQASRLEQLANEFGLDRFDVDVLLLALAPALDVRYERLYGFLQDDVTRKRPTPNLGLDLLCAPGAERWAHLARFSADAPLFRQRLLEQVADSPHPAPNSLGQPLKVDDAVSAWLLGGAQLAAELQPFAELQPAAPAPADAVIIEPIRAALERAGGEEVWLFHGPDRAAQLAAARALAQRRQCPLLTVDWEAARRQASAAQLLRLALRDARLHQAVVMLLGWGHGDETAASSAEVFAHPATIILASAEAWQPAGVERRRRAWRLAFPTPGFEQRRRLWQHFLGGADYDVAALASQFALQSDQIRDAVATAHDLAAQRAGPEASALTEDDLRLAARAHSNPRLGQLARKIKPRYQWADIILPPDQILILREIVAMVRSRPRVLEDWGVGRKLASSAGVTVLFAGAPGTGKTMAADIIAAELGLDLYKIELSGVISKYIGETEKNLERIFSEAQSSNAILFFDEADSIFGKRSEVKDAHDRYANIEISYLLQRMEAYDGVTVLATNLRANLDEAFTRRLQFAVDFPFPDDADRLRLWQTLFPPEVPRAADLDLERLARRFKLSGGNIRNVIVTAAYLAASDSGQVTMHHLLHGIRRELQKMGRLVADMDFGPAN
jgi:AAA+ superfamily predicted ATPase